MSENHEGDQNTNGEGQDQDNENVDWKSKYLENAQKLDELRSTNDRLLDQSKDWKDKAKSFQSQLDEFKRDQVDGQNAEQQRDYWKGKFEALEKDHVSLRTSTATDRLKSDFREIAPDCRNIELVLNNPAYSKDFKEAVDPSSLTVNRDILESIYKKDKEENPFVYSGKKLPGMVGGGADSDTTKTDEVDTSKMSPDEHREYLQNKWGNQPQQ